MYNFKHIIFVEVKPKLSQNEILKFINLNKVFDNGFEAVKNFNLTINKGEFVTLLGPSGCGKTTILKMLAGFEHPTRGKILYNNLDIKDLPIYDRPTATVFQDYALFPNMTVRQNIEYGLKVIRVQSEDYKIDEQKVKKIYDDALIKSKNKIKEIEKRKQTLMKDIKKCDLEYEKRKGWFEHKNMRHNSYVNTIKKLQNELYKTYGDDFVTKQDFSNYIKTMLNIFFLKIKLPNFRFNVSTKKMNDIEKKINEITKIYSAKCLLDKKYDNLQYKYTDLDYLISYWQNFPNQQKERYLKKTCSRKLTNEEILQKTNKVIELVGLRGKEDLMPSELSGGMQQRVALARSIVIEPEILLLDEPLSALDAKVRTEMQKEMKRLHNELKITFILVTHDQEEALTLSDKVVVMSNGKLEQVGTPNKIYDYPENKWVASFVGKANFFKGKYIGNNKVEFIGLKQKVEKIYKFKENTRVDIMIRPEDFDVVKKDEGFINAKVNSVVYKGMMYDIKCSYNDYKLNVEGINKVEVGSTIGLKWDIEDLHLIRS